MAVEERSKGLLGVLQPDLRALGLEAKSKKHLPIKEAAERSTVKLRLIEEQHSHDTNAYLHNVSESQEVLRPFLLALDSGEEKMILIGLGGIQKLIAHCGVSPSNSLRLIQQLSAFASNPSDSVKLKTLQAAVALLTTKMEVPHSLSLSLTLSLFSCFALVLLSSLFSLTLFPLLSLPRLLTRR
jgi:hypothetical protein